MNAMEAAFRFTRLAEGWYSDNPNDTGGETLAGISRRWHPKWAGWELVDEIKRAVGGHPALDKALHTTEIEELIKEFYKNWWYQYKCNWLQSRVAVTLFDSTFMTGQAVWLLQKAINKYKGQAAVVEDNTIGSNTISAANKCNPYELASIMIAKRIKYQMQLQDKRPFYRGWADRAAELQLYIWDVQEAL